MTQYRFTGPQGPARKYGANKGVMRQLREFKRQEAQERQARYLRGESLNPYGLTPSEELGNLQPAA